jgi:hypothetical protein
MFGVLVVILCPDHVADLGFSTGERQIPFIVSLRVLGAVRLGASGHPMSAASSVQQMTLPAWVARTHDCLWVIFA